MGLNQDRGDRKTRSPRLLPLDTLAHHVGNTVGAIKLRLDLVNMDSTCRWAQQESLQIMSGLLDEASESLAILEERLRAPAAAQRVKRSPPRR